MINNTNNSNKNNKNNNIDNNNNIMLQTWADVLTQI